MVLIAPKRSIPIRLIKTIQQFAKVKGSSIVQLSIMTGRKCQHIFQISPHMLVDPSGSFENVLFLLTRPVMTGKKNRLQQNKR
jgi:hypothetical protein